MAGKINLTDELKKYFGFNKFKGNQEAIINNLLDGKDTFVLMPTGGGKSLCYQLPSVLMEGTAIVISPLIALMKNQVDAMRNFSEEDGVAHFINSSLNKGAIDQVRSDILAGKTKLLYVAPESLTKEENVEFLRSVKISFYAVDEAHCISEWGHDFRPEYRRIRPIINEIGKAPLIALTATATPKVQHDIQKNLGMVDAQVFKSSFNRPNLYYEVRAKTANIDRDIIKFIKNNPEKSGIIYCLSRKKVEELAEILQANGINARPYHAGMDSLTRTKNQDDFLMEKVDVIVATIAFGMGIDKPDVRIVVHFDIPDSPEAYFQEAGRAGRDGKKAYAVLLYNEAALTALKKRVTQGFPDKNYIRQVYRLLGDFFGLEEGLGHGLAFEFDPEHFVKTYKLELTTTLSAIKVLQVAGYLECTTEVHARSRISFLVLRDQLYKIELGDLLLERLVEYILRNYPGIFVQYAYIDEEILAGKLGVKRQQVYESLLLLARRRIIGYIPGNDRPYIVYHQPRVPAHYLHIGPEAYEDRKQAYAVKVGHMAGYIELTDSCRQLYLMAYFGQREKEVCGICDLCLEQKKRPGNTNRKTEEKILELLKQKDYEIRELIYESAGSRQQATACIRKLLDAGEIYYKTPTLLALRH